MRINNRLIKIKPGAWILVPSLLIAVFSPFGVAASSDPGITVTIYDNYGFNGSPPMPDVSEISISGTTTYEDINQNFDSLVPFGLSEDFIVKYEGHITSPVTGSIKFWPWADDGTKFYLDNVLIDDGNWVDKGGGGYQTEPQQFTAGESKPFTYWYYENGGGAWTILYWDIGNGWEVVPSSAFTKNQVAPTTTTIAPSLGKPTNITLDDTGYGIKIDWDAPQGNITVSPERYAISWSTGNSGWGVPTGNVGDEESLNTEITLDYSLFSSTGGLSSKYLITVRADNDTYGIYSQQSDPVTLEIGVYPVPPTTTTTTSTVVYPPTTSATISPETTTTSEPEITTTIVLPFPESTSSTIIETTTTEVPVVSTTTPVEEENVGVGVEPEPSVQETLPEPEQLPEDETPTQETASELPLIEEVNTQSMSANEISETVIDILKEPLNDEEFVAALESIFNEPLSNEQFDAAITAVLDSELSDEQFSEVIGILESDSITVEQVESAVNNIIENGITEDQATELATSAKVLESITSDAATEIFQEINVEALSDEQSAEIVAAVQNAPTEVKESFEEEINIFEGGFDDYVPVDSAVSVGERRTIVAVTVVSSVIAISAAAAPPAPSAPSGGGSSGGDPPSGGDNGGNKSRRRRGGIN